MSPARPDPDHVRAVVRGVLAQKEFQGAESGDVLMKKLTEWVQHAVEALEKFIRELPPWASRLLGVWMILTLLAILAHTVYTLFLLGGRGTAQRRAVARAALPDLLGIRSLDFDHVREEAFRARDAGDLPRAIRYAYAACILLFDRVGWAAFDGSKTNREYALAVRVRSAASGAVFDRATWAFEGVAYGPEPATLATANGLLGDLLALEAETRVAR